MNLTLSNHPKPLFTKRLESAKNSGALKIKATSESGKVTQKIKYGYVIY